MLRIPGFLKDPLTHFLIAGAVLVYVGSVLAPAEPGKSRIIVDRAALVKFIQYRSKAFDPVAAASLLDSMEPERRDRLVKDFIEEEALYRQAKALSLEESDYVIKQRLVQKIRFATEAAVGEPELSEEEIAAYYEANCADYAIAPYATFSHVFFNARENGFETARMKAAKAIESLNEQKAGFESAVRLGDRFLFHTNYVERTFDYVASQFGEEAATKIFDFAGPFGVWRGPLVSPYGAHAVYVKDVAPGRTPPLEEIFERVREDAVRAAKAERARALIEQTIENYEVIIRLDDPAPSKSPAPPAASDQ